MLEVVELQAEVYGTKPIEESEESLVLDVERGVDFLMEASRIRARNNFEEFGRILEIKTNTRRAEN